MSGADLGFQTPKLLTTWGLESIAIANQNNNKTTKNKTQDKSKSGLGSCLAPRRVLSFNCRSRVLGGGVRGLGFSLEQGCINSQLSPVPYGTVTVYVPT